MYATYSHIVQRRILYMLFGERNTLYNIYIDISIYNMYLYRENDKSKGQNVNNIWIREKLYGCSLYSFYSYKLPVILKFPNEKFEGKIRSTSDMVTGKQCQRRCGWDETNSHGLTSPVEEKGWHRHSVKGRVPRSPSGTLSRGECPKPCLDRLVLA